jgi:hypothetical protein
MDKKKNLIVIVLALVLLIAGASVLYNRLGEKIVINAPQDLPGGHGGSDEKIRQNLFVGCESDPLGQMADIKAGMMSIGIGMAANISMKENRRVYLDEFYKD